MTAQIRDDTLNGLAHLARRGHPAPTRTTSPAGALEGGEPGRLGGGAAARTSN